MKGFANGYIVGLGYELDLFGQFVESVDSDLNGKRIEKNRVESLAGDLYLNENTSRWKRIGEMDDSTSDMFGQVAGLFVGAATAVLINVVSLMAVPGGLLLYDAMLTRYRHRT